MYLPVSVLCRVEHLDNLPVVLCVFILFSFALLSLQEARRDLDLDWILLTFPLTLDLISNPGASATSDAGGDGVLPLHLQASHSPYSLPSRP